MSRNFFIVFISFMLGMTAAEIVLRWVLPISRVSYLVDPQVGTLLVPNQTGRHVGAEFDQVVKTNSQGFHDQEHKIKKPSNVYRVVVVGDSYAEALQVSTQASITGLLRQKLKVCIPDKEIEVINLGMSGNGPAQYYRLLEQKGLQYQPDLVLMLVCLGNDFADSSPELNATSTVPFYSLQADGQLNFHPPQAKIAHEWLRELGQESALFRLLRKAFRGKSLENLLVKLGLVHLSPLRHLSNTVPVVEWLIYKSNPPPFEIQAETITLRMIKESYLIAKNSGAQFLVATIPERSTVEGLWPTSLKRYGLALDDSWDFFRPEVLILKHAEQEGYRVIGMTSRLQQLYLNTHKSLYLAGDGHWNAAGHLEGARLVAEEICKNN